MADVSNFGRPGEQACMFFSAAAHDTPGIAVFETVNPGGTKVYGYLWLDSNGKFRVHSAMPTDQDADGVVVGAQIA